MAWDMYVYVASFDSACYEACFTWKNMYVHVYTHGGHALASHGH